MKRWDLFLANYEVALQREGDVAEFGVFEGETSEKLCEKAQDLNKRVYLFDSFEGLPMRGPRDHPTTNSKGYYRGVREDVIKRLSAFDCWEICEGDFSEFVGFNRPLCFAYVDADLYQSTVTALEIVLPLIVPGGCVCIDDYDTSMWWPGVKPAVDEMLPETFEIYVDDRPQAWAAYAWRLK